MEVVLVGLVAPGIENHSLAVLGAALSKAGCEHEVVPFVGFAGMRSMLSRICELDPRIVGVSLQTTEAALPALALSKLLRTGGYRGTIVFGGHFATVAADEILAAGAGVDVVVQLAGEDAIVGLAAGHDPLTLPGTITRGGRGGTPVAVRPAGLRRERLSEHLGFGAADIIVSRGCPASCGYCCVASASDLADRTGSSRHVVREVEDIADEVAALTSRGARAFHFMDDNVLPLDPSQAYEWANALRGALARRRVPRIAFSLQLRADVVTPAVADALVELGLVRAYVGIDGYSTGQLRSIGRSAEASSAQRALTALTDRGVFCVANALLVGPTIGFDTIAAEVDALARIEGAPVHLLPIEARPGTVYHRRASARGLIEGGFLWPVHRFADHRSFLVGEVITRLPTRLAERSVPVALYDLGWGIGVSRRLAPDVDASDAVATYRAVTNSWNRDQARLLRDALVAARAGESAVEALLAREQPMVRAHDEGLLAAADRALADLERRLSALHRRSVRAHARARVLHGIAFSMGLAAACGPPPQPGIDAQVVDAGVDAPDAQTMCVDESRTVQWFIDSDATCQCADITVRMTFDDDGEVVSIVGPGGRPLPKDIETCLLDLLAPYCYPSLAGMTREFTTCHMWIA